MAPTASWRSVAVAVAVALGLALRTPAVRAVPDAGTDPDASPQDVPVNAPVAQTPVPDEGVPPAPTDPLDESASPEEDNAARTALGADENPPDPVAEEAERTGPMEGPALSGNPVIATEIAALTDRACLRALARARVPVARVRTPVPGIALPVHVTGPLHGVTYIASGARAVDDVMDCRLAVALTRFSTQLRALGVHEVRHLSMYRPPDARSVASHPVQGQHPGGMAIDAAVFVRDDGERMDVERDFHGRRRRPPCGPTARVPTLHAARFLRTVACDAARNGTFHVVLTPDFNVAHHNHFHLEVVRGVSWQFVR